MKEAQRLAKRPIPFTRIVEDVLGCKWTLTILQAVRSGVRRPGRIRASIPGLSTKVMNERLSKLVRFGVLERQVFPELPPRVEYRFTPLGKDLGSVLRRIAALESRQASGRTNPRS